ncbi:MAG: oligosaccharide flippase family protein [Pseudomonadota bacterium]
MINLLGGEGLQARVLRGTGLTLLSYSGAQMLRLGSNLVLTRILFPEVFGLMALVQVFMTGLQMFSDLGLRTSVIQNDRGDDLDFLGTAFTLQIARGVVLWAAAWAIAAPAAAFYETPMLAELLPMAGLTSILLGVSSMNIAWVNRHLRLGRLTALELGTQAVGIAAMVGLAILWESVWAIVVGGLVGSFARAILSHIVLPGPRVGPRWDPSALRDIVRFGKYIFLGTLAGFLVSQGDRAILGAYVDLTQLALYNIAFFLATVPLMASRMLADRVLFPLYRSVPPGESAANRGKILRARLGLTGATMAAAAVPALGGVWIIEFLYDPRYHGAGPMLVLLTLASLPALITAGHGMVLLAVGNSRDFTLLMVTAAVVQTGLMVLGIELYGLAGLILLPALGNVVIYPLIVGLVGRHGGWDWRHDLSYALAALAIAALAVWLNQAALADLMSAVVA